MTIPNPISEESSFVSLIRLSNSLIAIKGAQQLSPYGFRRHHDSPLPQVNEKPADLYRQYYGPHFRAKEYSYKR